MNKLAIALCRVSSTEQLENNSLHRQRDAVLQAAKDLGVSIPDDGWWSGSVSSKRGTNVDRKDLQEMIERCKKDKRIKYLIVDEVDRFMRSMLEIGYFITQFKKLGVSIAFASQPNIKTDTAIDTLLLMLEAFKAEGSNEERQHKSIVGQTKALQEGRYTFSPKPGYKRGYERGIQEVHPVRGPALQKVLVRLASKLITPSQALVELNKSDFMDGHAPYKLDKFRIIVTDPFYAGIVEINKQVKVRNENGLHEPLITKEQHEELVRIMTDKKKNQSGPRKNGNPNFPCNNIVKCDECLSEKNGRVVGSNHTNGKSSSKVWPKYRCRSCSRYIARDELHDQIALQFKLHPFTQEDIDDLTKALQIVWKQREGDIVREKLRLSHKIKTMQETIAQQVEAATDPANIEIRSEIHEAIGRKKNEVAVLEDDLEKLDRKDDNDKEEFLNFAFNFVKEMGTRFLDEGLSQDNRIRCKQIVFPEGFYVNADKKVYTPEISPLITLVTKKKDAEASINSHLVRVTGL